MENILQQRDVHFEPKSIQMFLAPLLKGFVRSALKMTRTGQQLHRSSFFIPFPPSLYLAAAFTA